VTDDTVAETPQPTLRLVNWNVEWARGSRPTGEAIKARVAEVQPHVICLTESHADFFQSGHVITSEADYGYGDQGSRRKVVLWSECPWTEITTIGEPQLPSGRFVAGTTQTPLGPVRFVGVCIPWKDAHVRTGKKNRKPWQDHEQFLQGLPQSLTGHPQERLIVLGDFNQTIPRTRAPEPIHDQLMTALGMLACATAGPLADAPSLAIDHVCHSADLRAEPPVILSNRHDELGELSDHFGIGATLTRETRN
jgi:endonuclease/exonuclease/phosphatase family metal-dependent hydrolase